MDEIEGKRQEAEEALKRTKKKSRDTWLLAVGVAQASWSLVQSVLESAGVELSGTVRAAIQGAFSVASILIPLYTAMEVTPGMQVAATIGLINAGLAIANAAFAESRMDEIEKDLRQNTSQIFGDVLGIVGSFNFK